MAIRLRLLLLLLCALSFPAHGQPTTSNLEREKNWADQVVDTVVVGDPVWLTNRGHPFLTLYAPPAAPGSRTAVILLHGRGVHPAWGLINKLRADIAESGFHTLSLQLPILTADAPLGSYGPTLPEAIERINAGIRFLRDSKGVQHFLMLGHSSGANTALAYAARSPQAGVLGAVAISASTSPNSSNDLLQPAQMLARLRLPVLDIYGGSDLHEVMDYATDRRDAARKAGNHAYRQIRIPDADHFYSDHYDVLRTHVVNWLKPFHQVTTPGSRPRDRG